MMVCSVLCCKYFAIIVDPFLNWSIICQLLPISSFCTKSLMVTSDSILWSSAYVLDLYHVATPCKTTSGQELLLTIMILSFIIRIFFVDWKDHEACYIRMLACTWLWVLQAEAIPGTSPNERNRLVSFCKLACKEGLSLVCLHLTGN